VRLLITGSDGLVGTNIIPTLSSQFEIIPFIETQWDITDRARGASVLAEVKPDWLINLAAITDVDGCEDKPEAAFRVNGEGPGVLASLCAARGARLLHFSTDYVFDGKGTVPYTEGQPTNPLCIYGKSKRQGEKRALAEDPSAIIVRTEWIYGDGGESFITKVVKGAQANGSAQVVDDQTGAPTYAKDLAVPIAELINRRRQGIYHVTNDGSTTWYGFARHIFSILGMDVPCTPLTSGQLQRKAPRPAYSVLDCTKMTSDTGIRMRSWQQAVEEYLKNNESDLLFRRTHPA
jgi:dTDP-4-dehydrorhamnose reductase